MGRRLPSTHRFRHWVKWDHPLASQELGSHEADQAGPTPPRSYHIPGPILPSEHLSSSQPLAETAPADLHAPPPSQADKKTRAGRGSKNRGGEALRVLATRLQEGSLVVSLQVQACEPFPALSTE